MVSPQAESTSFEMDPYLDASKSVSDAQSGLQAAAVAQQTGGIPDLSSDKRVSLPNKTVIDVLTSDPSTEGQDIPIGQLELSPAGNLQKPSGSDKDELASSVEGLETTTSPQLAIADAKTDSLSSQLAIVTHVTPGGLDGSDTANAQPISAAALQERTSKDTAVEAGISIPPVGVKQATAETTPPADPTDNWCTHAKGLGKRLSKKGEAFTLPTGEACIKIPNSVIEKHRKSWEPFILGQFYSDPHPKVLCTILLMAFGASNTETSPSQRWRVSLFCFASQMPRQDI